MGYDILVGKNAKANDKFTSQYAKKNTGKFPADHVANQLRSGIAGAHGSVDMPVWGTVRTSKASGLSSVDLYETPLLRIRYRIEEGRDPIHLWAKWQGVSRKTHRTRVWRSFAPPGKWTIDTIDLLHALRSHGEEPKKLLSLEFGTQRVPHEVRLGLLEIRNSLS